ncbi:hypothetical protein [Cupriavidus campinensis]|uniref:hypothetical protein n=1 Tax=Cupriavidus campinensis TaxID=151783 RepID=UPI0024E1CEC9|nr:hypothetical protein [Cupriavidus campinensis]
MSTSTELTLPQRAAVALGSAEHEAKLKELAAKHADIVEIKNPAGREQAHGAMMTLATARIAITKAGKAARDDANAFSKAVIAEEKRLIEIIEPEESRLRGMRDEWDAAREREKEAKAATERQRIAALQERITEIRGAVAAASFGCSPALVLEHIGDIERMVIDSSFEEFQGQAQLAKDETLDKLREIHAAAVAREEEAARLKAEQEAEAARLAAEREELARLRAEAAERERVAAAQRAEEERQAREAREAEERRLAEERAAQEATLRAEREAHERQLAAERAEADRIAREKLAAEEAELRAERERQAAEAKRLADERAELDRQQREAEEQRRRDEAARQAHADAADAQVRGAAYEMLDALRQWRYAEQTGDADELANARKARDEAIDAATLVDAEFVEA